MAKLSKHFTTEEFACKCGCGFGAQAEDIDPELITRLEQMRLLTGPITITSGARCAIHNKKIGGARLSAHLPAKHNGKCHAADCAIKGSQQRYEYIMAALSVDIKRIGIARTFVHVDTLVTETHPQDVVWLY